MEVKFIQRIQRAIDYIEDRLHESIQIEDVAKAAYMSQSALYNMFSSLTGTSVKEYIRNRRLSLSAYDLIFTDMRILDIAVKFQYSSYESYSRAFKKVYKISPNKYRRNGEYTNIYPRVTLRFRYYTGGNDMVDMDVKRDFLIEEHLQDTDGYILSLDIDDFKDININYGYSIGDKVLKEIPERIQSVFQCYQISADVTHVNSDEFVVIIKEDTSSYIHELTHDIINVLNTEFTYGNISIKISVTMDISKFSLDQNDEDLIKNAQRTLQITKEKRNQRYIPLD
ncbi:helix-turn-helix domain-containing protein [Alkaliphilus serpentinus]|uniref:Helix-turn-helix domain-containing protein n=1 Tax=Alkaliphilus serpentinus TaxID=1482731 RepID=A0A833M903_9FIRM|nr:helix-turn-helix domain-containing protein [Alkaliphilus serpentinus]KAB3526342.1 helix-turn-helix domain-containing protein [Alkaliphilus serpentinus]